MRNPTPLRRNIVLVGPMGSGKSHVGRLLAALLGMSFVDVDAGIETAAGMPIAEIFATEGEPGFRLRESRVLAGALERRGQVVATGGGAVLDAGNRAAMRTCHVVYLQVDPEEQLRRLAGDESRPLLAGQGRAARLRELQRVREPLYREVADLVFATGLQSAEDVARELAALVGQARELRA